MRASSFLQSLRCAWAGISWTIRTQRNARVHLAIALAVTALTAALRLSSQEAAVIALTIAVVFVTELLNTALEAAVDIASPETQPLARIAKDAAAAAVLTASCGAIIVGVLILGPPLWSKVSG